MKITYSSNYLKSLNKSCYPIKPELRNELNRLQTFTKKTKRGYRGGRHKQRQITVVKGYRPPGKGQLPRPPTVLTPIPQELPPAQSTHSRTKDPSPAVPGFFLTNTRSTMNKLDELDVLLHQSDNQTDIAVLTETWQSDKIPDDFLSIDGYNIFTRTRDIKRGGGVAVYVKEQTPVMVPERNQGPGRTRMSLAVGSSPSITSQCVWNGSVCSIHSTEISSSNSFGESHHLYA